MAIRKAYQKEGFAGVQLLLPFEASRHAVRKQANRMGIRSEFTGGRNPSEETVQERNRKPAYTPDPLMALLRGWYHLVESGNLAWRP